jgi:hypothetical protein
MRLFTIFIILIDLLHLLNVSPLHQPPPTMAPTTRAKKDKPIGRATNTTATTSVIRSTPQKARRNAQSPSESNVNTHLADINKPTLRIENVLQAL